MVNDALSYKNYRLHNFKDIQWLILLQLNYVPQIQFFSTIVCVPVYDQLDLQKEPISFLGRTFNWLTDWLLNFLLLIHCGIYLIKELTLVIRNTCIITIKIDISFELRIDACCLLWMWEIILVRNRSIWKRWSPPSY